MKSVYWICHIQWHISFYGSEHSIATIEIMYEERKKINKCILLDTGAVIKMFRIFVTAFLNANKNTISSIIESNRKAQCHLKMVIIRHAARSMKMDFNFVFIGQYEAEAF